jgi:hypothetical protein
MINAWFPLLRSLLWNDIKRNDRNASEMRSTFIFTAMHHIYHGWAGGKIVVLLELAKVVFFELC